MSSKKAAAFAKCAVERGGAYIIPDEAYPPGWTELWAEQRTKRVEASVPTDPDRNRRNRWVRTILAHEDAQRRVDMKAESARLRALPPLEPPVKKRKSSRLAVENARLVEENEGLKAEIKSLKGRMAC